MPSYLVETYLPRGDAGTLASRSGRARSAARELTRAGTPVSFERSIHLPEDETCFYVFVAPSRAAAALAAERGALDAVRVVEAVLVGEELS